MTASPTSMRPRAIRLARFVVLPVGLALAAGAAAERLPAMALVNESLSLPKGLYWRTSGDVPEPGEIVAATQTVPARRYLSGQGVPADMPLIKRVAAVGGQTVCAGDGAVETPVGRYRVLHRDRTGRVLPVWRGCRPLAPDELFLVGDTDTSFDSRYFGPVTRGDLLGVYRRGPSW